MTDEKELGEPLAEERTTLPKNRVLEVWESLATLGLAETALRLGTHVLLIALILIVAWGMREFYRQADIGRFPGQAALAADSPTATPTQSAAPPQEDAFSNPLPARQAASGVGIARKARLHTDVPSRARVEVLKYTVKSGDTVFGLAEKFGLKPETILWGNQFVLGDNPHNLRPGQELNILPVDGAYHRWSQGDGLNGVAKFFHVQPEDIVDWSGNGLDPTMIGDFSNPNIEAGTWLIIPGGSREFVSWSAPEIPRDNPSVSNVLGEGACGSAVSGAIGTPNGRMTSSGDRSSITISAPVGVAASTVDDGAAT